MGKSGGQAEGENFGISTGEGSGARPVSCAVTTALERLESAVDAVASGPLTPVFLRKLFSMDLLDGAELDMFTDLLDANRSLKSALAESRGRGS